MNNIFIISKIEELDNDGIVKSQRIIFDKEISINNFDNNIYYELQDYITIQICSTRDITLKSVNNNYYISIILFTSNNIEELENNFVYKIEEFIKKLNPIEIKENYNNLDYYEKVFNKNKILKTVSIIGDKFEEETKQKKLSNSMLKQQTINSCEFGAGNIVEQIFYDISIGVLGNLLYDILLKPIINYIINYINKKKHKEISMVKINNKDIKNVRKFIEKNYEKKFYKDLILTKVESNKKYIITVWEYKQIKELKITYYKKSNRFICDLNDK